MSIQREKKYIFLMSVVGMSGDTDGYRGKRLFSYINFGLSYFHK